MDFVLERSGMYSTLVSEVDIHLLRRCTRVSLGDEKSGNRYWHRGQAGVCPLVAAQVDMTGIVTSMTGIVTSMTGIVGSMTEMR